MQKIVQNRRILLSVWTVTLGLLLCIVSETEAQGLLDDMESDRTTEPLRLYTEGRLSLAVPTVTAGSIFVSGAGLGQYFNTPFGQQSLGLRLIWIPSPPANPLAKNDSAYDLKTDHGIGPVVDWRLYLGDPLRSFNFFINASGGFIYGVPNKETRDAAEAEGEEARNVVIPIFEVGGGIRLSHHLSKKQSVYISPEFGFVPAVNAPYMAVTGGLSF